MFANFFFYKQILKNIFKLLRLFANYLKNYNLSPLRLGDFARTKKFMN